MLKRKKQQQATNFERKLDEAVYVTTAVPSPCRAAAAPGARLHADTPRGPPLLTGLNPTVYWCRNQLNPVGREQEGGSGDDDSVINRFIPTPPGRPDHCLCLTDAVLQERTQIHNTMRCSPTPAMFSETKYSTKGGNCLLFPSAWPQSIPSSPTVQHIHPFLAVYSLRTSPH